MQVGVADVQAYVTRSSNAMKMLAPVLVLWRVPCLFFSVWWINGEKKAENRRRLRRLLVLIEFVRVDLFKYFDAVFNQNADEFTLVKPSVVCTAYIPIVQ